MDTAPPSLSKLFGGSRRCSEQASTRPPVKPKNLSHLHPSLTKPVKASPLPVVPERVTSPPPLSRPRKINVSQRSVSPIVETPPSPDTPRGEHMAVARNLAGLVGAVVGAKAALGVKKTKKNSMTTVRAASPTYLPRHNRPNPPAVTSAYQGRPLSPVRLLNQAQRSHSAKGRRPSSKLRPHPKLAASLNEPKKYDKAPHKIASFTRPPNTTGSAVTVHSNATVANIESEVPALDPSALAALRFGAVEEENAALRLENRCLSHAVQCMSRELDAMALAMEGKSRDDVDRVHRDPGPRRKLPPSPSPQQEEDVTVEEPLSPGDIRPSGIPMLDFRGITGDDDDQENRLEVIHVKAPDPPGTMPGSVPAHIIPKPRLKPANGPTKTSLTKSRIFTPSSSADLEEGHFVKFRGPTGVTDEGRLKAVGEGDILCVETLVPKPEGLTKATIFVPFDRLLFAWS